MLELICQFSIVSLRSATFEIIAHYVSNYRQNKVNIFNKRCYKSKFQVLVVFIGTNMRNLQIVWLQKCINCKRNGILQMLNLQVHCS